MHLNKRTRTRASVLAIVFLIALCLLVSPVSWVSTLGLMPTANAYWPSAALLPEGTLFAVTSGNRLINFNGATPGALNSNVAITGLQSGESIVAIDFRPRTGQLIALGSTSRIYILNPKTGAATQIGSGQFSPALSGSSFGFDFNPTVDRIRVVSDGDQNLRLNPDTGAVAGTDTALAFATGDANASADPNVVGAAYTNNFAGATSTTLYGIDSNLDALIRIGSAGGSPTSPNTGQLSTIGSLGVNTTSQVGFDIGAGDTAYASLTTSGSGTSSLYSINLATGAATLIDAIGIADTIRDIATVPHVETIYAVSTNNTLLSFNSGTPDVVNSLAITNLPPGDYIVGIDFRPATGQLYAVSNASRLYTINTTTGAATPVSASALSPALSGSGVGFDFNPAADRIRIVSDTDQNIRVNPNTGVVAATDTNLAYAAGDPNAAANPNIAGAAYTNNLAGTGSTTLYGIDSNLDALVLQGSVGGTPNSPNSGQLTTVGALGVNSTDQIGFDIAPQTGAAFASLTGTGAGNSQLYTVNLATGAATLIGNIGGGAPIRDIAVAVHVEAVVALTSGNKLITFNSLTPGTITSTVAITGLQAGESLRGIDFRPATGELYGLGSSSRIYLINPVTGAATPVSNGPFTPALTGTTYGFDFNPVTDRIRVVNDATQNLLISPNNGAVVAVNSLTYAAVDQHAGNVPHVIGAAFTSNATGTASTTLYDIDTVFNVLTRQGYAGAPDSDSLFTIGPLGVDPGDQAGFDISDCTGIAYAAMTATGASTSQFYTINLVTGAATLVGNIGGTETIRGIAVATNFIPSAVNTGFAIVNAASFQGDSVAPCELASIFGSFQTTDGRSAVPSGGTMPTTLNGIKVSVNGVDAKLSYVSNGQINFLVPCDATPGVATVVVTNADGTTRVGTITITSVAPGIFAVRTSGSPVAAGFFTKNGVNYSATFNPDGTASLVDPGTTAMPTYVTLFGTGIRKATASNPNDQNGVAEAVTVTVQGIPATVTYAGAQGGFEGLDQVNFIVPPELAGTGIVLVKLYVNGQVSNTVLLNIGGTFPEVRFQTVSLGQTIVGQLTADDQIQLGGGGLSYFFDSYRFNATAGTTLAIDLRASLFDPLILLYRVESDGSRTLIAADDDSGGLTPGGTSNGNSLLLTVIQQSGTYEVFVSSADEDPNGQGSYTLRLGANALQSISYGQTVNGIFTTNDLRTSRGYLLDGYYFTGNAGDNIQIRMSSAIIDSFLILNLNTGQRITFDDDSGGGVDGLDALITRTLSTSGTYIIVATSFDSDATGSYSLSLTQGSNSNNAPVARLESSKPKSNLQDGNGKGNAQPLLEAGETSFDRYGYRRVIKQQ